MRLVCCVMGMHDRRRDLALKHLVDGARVSERVQLVRADVDARVANRVKAYVRDAGVEGEGHWEG